MGPGLKGAGGFDGGPTLADGAGTDVSVGAGGSADVDGSRGAIDSGGAGGSGGSRAEIGTEVVADSVGVGDDSGSEPTGGATDSGATEDADSAVDVPSSGGPEAADGRTGTDETGGMDDSRAGMDAAGDTVADSGVAVGTGGDALSVDALGKMTCPTTINGSLDPSDATQVGRHSRHAPASVCGTPKGYPGNLADPTNLHLYDAYHFINPTGSPVCFNFTLTYSGDRQLYAAAYGAFDPTNLATSYLGDVGGTLTPPQTMGITVDADNTIDVVVYATATGTAAAGSYTLGCSSE